MILLPHFRLFDENPPRSKSNLSFLIEIHPGSESNLSFLMKIHPGSDTTFIQREDAPSVLNLISAFFPHV